MKKAKRISVCVAALLVAFATNPSDGTRSRAFVTCADQINELFTIPAAELADLKTEVQADWAARDHTVAGWTVEASGVFLGCQLNVVSHLIDGDGDGLVNDKHYAAVRYPKNFTAGGSFPVLLVNHGGSGGVNINKLEEFDEGLPGTCVKDNFFIVMASYRGEGINAGPLGTFLSGGAKSVRNYDVDDVITLLDGVLANIAEADADRVASYGTSRGGSVTLLVDIRDHRIKRNIDFFGGTDTVLHKDDAISVACDGAAISDPSLHLILDEVVYPYLDGSLSLHDGRFKLVQSSPVFFVEDLSRLQIHHGTADPTVDIAQSESLVAALEAFGAPPPKYKYFVYEGGVHSVASLIGQGPRVQKFLCAML